MLVPQGVNSKGQGSMGCMDFLYGTLHVYRVFSVCVLSLIQSVLVIKGHIEKQYMISLIVLLKRYNSFVNLAI